MLACPTRSTRTYTLFPSTTLFRADPGAGVRGQLRHRVAVAARPARQPARQWLVIDSHLRLKALLGTATIVVLGLVAFAIGGLRIFERTYPLEVVLEDAAGLEAGDPVRRSEEHTSELQSLMRTSYAVFCLKTKNSK